MIIGTATLAGQTYELRHTAAGYHWWADDVAAIETAYTTPAEAIDALWSYLGLTVAREGWWQPADDDADITAAKRPRTVTDAEVRLGHLLDQRLDRLGLCIDNEAGTGARGLDYGLAWQEAAQLAEEVRVEKLLEQVARDNEIECELVQDGHLGWIVQQDTLSGLPDVLATGSTPAEAVEELRRELEGEP